MRVIDDFAASFVNMGLSADESVDPDDLDRIAVCVRMHMDGLCADDADRPRKSPFAGRGRHRDHEGAKLVARMWDLEAAYRQLARSPAHASLAVVAVWCPTEAKHKLYKMAALPFGAAASVYGFNWVASALKEVVVALLDVGATNFYDDFTVVEVDGACGEHVRLSRRPLQPPWVEAQAHGGLPRFGRALGGHPGSEPLCGGRRGDPEQAGADQRADRVD